MTHSMDKLMLIEVGADLQNLIKDRPRHGPETVGCHFVLGESHPAKSNKYRNIAHGKLLEEKKGKRPLKRKNPDFSGPFGFNRTVPDL